MNPIKIRVTDLYEFTGTRVILDRTKTYDAVPQTELPDYDKMKWVRIHGVNEPHGLCLKEGEYEIVTDTPSLKDCLD